MTYCAIEWQSVACAGLFRTGIKNLSVPLYTMWTCCLALQTASCQACLVGQMACHSHPTATQPSCLWQPGLTNHAMWWSSISDRSNARQFRFNTSTWTKLDCCVFGATRDPARIIIAIKPEATHARLTSATGLFDHNSGNLDAIAATLARHPGGIPERLVPCPS